MNSSVPEVATASLPANVREICAGIVKKTPMHNAFLQAAIGRMTAKELAHFDRYIDYCQQTGVTIDHLSECYVTVVQDTLAEQLYFRKHKKYRFSTFDEAAASVYFNPRYMSAYMYGLAVSAYLWPNHTAIFRFFHETFPLDRSGSYLEIGPGHGYFFLTAIEQSAYQSFTGVDVSETSIGQTRALIEFFHPGNKENVELRCMDFLDCTLPEAAYDAVVMGEVLEHVERPDLLLKQIARVAKKDAFIFVSTCLNAPMVDHIYLFDTLEQVEDLFNDCGLAIRKELICPYQGKTLEQSLKDLLAINVAYVLEKK